MVNNMKEKIYNENLGSLDLGFILICWISNLSQLPFFINNYFIKIIVMFSWIIMLYIVFIKYMKIINLKKLTKIIFLIFVFNIFILLMQLLTSKNYIKSNFVYPINLSVFVLIVSYFSGQFITKISIEKLINSFIYSSFLVGVYIYIDTFRGHDWSDSMGYLYTSKNSISTIFVISILCILLYWKNKNIVLKYSIFLFFIALVFMMKSRTSLLGLFICGIYFLNFIVKNRRKKFVYIIVLIGVISLIILNNNLYDIVVNKVIFNNRIGSDLNTLSSGRIDHFKIFSENFKFNPFYGNGGLYLESFPLAILISYGIVGSLPIFILSISPLIIGFTHRRDYKYIEVRRLMILLNILLLTNGLFEELSPFGPGVKCYLLWMITGIYLGLKVKKERIKINE